jgi:hypothetical protein
MALIVIEHHAKQNEKARIAMKAIPKSRQEILTKCLVMKFSTTKPAQLELKPLQLVPPGIVAVAVGH